MSMLANNTSVGSGGVGGGLSTVTFGNKPQKDIVEISTSKNVMKISNKQNEALSHSKAKENKALKKMAEDEDVEDEEEEEDNTTATEEVNGKNRGHHIGKNELSKLKGAEDYGNGRFVQNVVNDYERQDSLNQDNSVKKGKGPAASTAMLALAMPLPLVAAGHSLAPDMVDGWKPQADKEIPPIPFCFGLVAYNLEQFNYPKVLYVGPRFKNSYKMHEQYSNKLMKLPIQNQDGENVSVYAYPFTFPKFYDSNNFTYEEAFEAFVSSMEHDSSILDQDLNFQMASADTHKRDMFPHSKTLLTAISMKDEREEFVFDSNFESGNLDFVGKVSENEYDLLMRLDSNSRSHQQWFYFSVDCKDIRRRSTKGETIKINILNFTKPNTLYNQGMRPVAWSKQKCATEGIGWHRVGQNIQYRHSKLSRQNQTYGYNRIWYQMTFEFTFEYDQDKIWFAYAIPYSFTMLINFIKAVEEIQKKPENQKNSQIFKKEILGKSLSGVEIPILTITDFNETNKRKKTILMVGRLHPGETHSSWLIHGFIRFILSESPKARELRRKIVFKIVPMLNPDGVIIGNYRCTLCGFDMNRNFGGETAAAALRINPETNLFKNMAKQQSRLAFFFDVHSHSSKKSVFIYGPYFPLHSEHYLKIRVLPRLISEKTSMFRYYSCRFRNEVSKMHCSRLTIFRDCNLPQCYTIETSIMGFLTKERQNVSFGIPSLQYFGEKLAETLLDWFQILEIHQREKIKKAILMSKQRKTRKRTLIDIIGEEDYLEYRDVIDTQLQQQEEELQRQELLEQQANMAKKKKKPSNTGRRKSGVSKNINNGSQNKKKGNANASGNIVTNIVTTGGDGLNGQEIMIMDMNENENNEEQLPIGVPASLGEIESAIAQQLEGIKVNLFDKMKTKKKQRGQNGGSSLGIMSSEEVDEEEDDEDYFNQSAKNQRAETLEPKLTQFKLTEGDDPKQDLTTNKGFFVPKLAGFEYLEGQQKKHPPQRPSSSYNHHTRNANADLVLTGQHSSTNIQDDDEMFIYEDQAANAALEAEPLRRLEDIVGQIKKDFIKANTTTGAAAQAVNNGGGADHDQFQDERDMDSEKSDDEERKKKDPYDDEYEEQTRKMEMCLNSYFENVEEIQSRGRKGGQKKAVLVQPPAIQVVVKEKPVVKQQETQKVSPVKIQRPYVQQQIVKPETLIPQKKEIVFSLKKPAITNYPPEKPIVQHTYASTRPPTYFPLGQTFMHYNRAVVNSTSPKQPHQESKDLQFTLMNKTNQEFFDLLNKYVDNKGQNPAFANQNFQRANSALSQSRQQTTSLSKPQQQPQQLMVNQQLIHQLQSKQQRPLTTNQNSTISVNNDHSSIDHPRYAHVSSSSRNNNQILQAPQAIVVNQQQRKELAQKNEVSMNYGTIIQNSGSKVSENNFGMIGIHIDSTATKSAIRRRAAIATQMQLSSGKNKDKASISSLTKVNTNENYESPIKRKLTVDNNKFNIKAIQSASGKKTGRIGAFMLMVDGRGVVSQTEMKGLSTQQKPNHSQTATSLKQMLQNQGMQERGTLPNPAQVYETTASQQVKLKKSKTKVFGNHSRSFIGGPAELSEIRALAQNSTDQSNFLKYGRQNVMLNQASIDEKPIHSRHSSINLQNMKLQQNSSPQQKYSPDKSTKLYMSQNEEDIMIPEFQVSSTSVSPNKPQQQYKNMYIEAMKQPYTQQSLNFYQSSMNPVQPSQEEGVIIINDYSTRKSQIGKRNQPNHESQTSLRLIKADQIEVSEVDSEMVSPVQKHRGLVKRQMTDAEFKKNQPNAPAASYVIPNSYIQQHSHRQMNNSLGNIQAGGQSPMKNQILIDMFRQTSHNMNGGGNKSQVLGEAILRPMTEAIQTRRLNGQQSNRLIINLQDSQNSDKNRNNKNLGGNNQIIIGDISEQFPSQQQLTKTAEPETMKKQQQFILNSQQQLQTQQQQLHSVRSAALGSKQL